MERNYNTGTMIYSASEDFNANMAVPESATAAQLKEFDAYVESIKVNPLGLMIEAYERIFDEPYNDGTEESPNKVEGAVE